MAYLNFGNMAWVKHFGAVHYEGVDPVVKNPKSAMVLMPARTDRKVRTRLLRPSGKDRKVRHGCGIEFAWVRHAY